MEIGKKSIMSLPVEVKVVDKDNGTLEAIFSTQDVDRHGDTVIQEGWDLTNFKKNPVILNSHNYGDAAEVIGKASNVRIEKKKLIGNITFAINENPKAKVIFDLYSNGFLSAFSVGFIPSKFKEDKNGNVDWYIIEEAELLEVSAVSVPANARALAKKKGIEVDVLEEEPEVPEEKDEDVAEEDEEEVIEKEADEIIDEAKDKEIEVDEDNEVVENSIKPSYNKMVLDSLDRISQEKKMELKRIKKILDSILDNDTEGKKLEEETKSKIEKRKINQAIRGLMKMR